VVNAISDRAWMTFSSQTFKLPVKFLDTEEDLFELPQKVGSFLGPEELAIDPLSPDLAKGHLQQGGPNGRN
jgi:hypothetical protein